MNCISLNAVYMTKDMMLYVMLIKSINTKMVLLISVLGGASSVFSLFVEFPDLFYRLGEFLGIPAFGAALYVAYSFWNAKRKFRIDEFDLTTKKLKDILDRESKEKDGVTEKLIELQQEYKKIFQELLVERRDTLSLHAEIQKLRVENTEMRAKNEAMQKEIDYLQAELGQLKKVK